MRSIALTSDIVVGTVMGIPRMGNIRLSMETGSVNR